MSYIGTEPKDIRSFGRTQFDYTATQGQTAFTGADDDGKVLAFTTGQINVFVNGILMDDSDFTTTGTGTVTLASAANLNDVISIVSFESNIPDNDYVPASGGTFSGNVTHSGTVTNSGNVTVGGTLGVTGATTIATLTGTSAGFTGDVNIGNNASSNPLSKLRLGGTQYGAADIRPTDEGGHKVGMAFYTDGTGDTTIDPVLRMTIDSSGRVTKPNQPGFSAYRDAGTVTSGNVYIFDHTNYNVGSMYDTSTGRGTVPVAGRYLVTVWLMSENNATYDNKYLRLRINATGASAEGYKNIYSSSGGVVHHQFSWSGVINLSANDYIDIYVDNLDVYGNDPKYSNFTMHLLS